MDSAGSTDSQSSCSDEAKAPENAPEGAVGENGCGDSFNATDENPVHVTDSAVSAIREAIQAEGEEGDGLRVSVIGGGCSGYQYNLDFDKEARMGDLTLSYDGVSIFIDPVSAGLLKGTVIDYVSGLNGTGFKFENPNANRTCGCGSSFS